MTGQLEHLFIVIIIITSSDIDRDDGAMKLLMLTWYLDGFGF